MSGKKFRCKGCEAILVAAPTAAIAPPLPSAEKRKTPEAAPRKKRVTSAPEDTEAAPRRKKKRPQKKRRAPQHDAANPFGALDDFGDDYGEDYTSEDNPYAAPKAKSRGKKKSRGRSSSTLTVSQKLFSFEGRINRSDYWTYNILTSIVGNGTAFGLLAMAGEGGNQGFAIAVLVLLIPLVIALTWISFAIIVKRLHDRDRSGWFALCSFIPLANLWVLIECAFLAGTPGRNDFGSEPS